MEELSGPDLFYLMKEFCDLERSKIRKAYVEGNEVHLSLYSAKKGSGSLVIGPNYIFYTNKPLVHSPVPDAYCMHLRKRVIGQIIESIGQIGFERIIRISMRDMDLVVELFSKGNIIITDKDGKIMSLRSSQSWKDRKLKSGLVYELPPKGINPVDLKEDELVDAVSSSEKKIISLLARTFGLGGKFAEETVFRAGIDKDMVCKDIGKVKIKKLHCAIGSLFGEKIEAFVSGDDAAPFMIARYSDASGDAVEKKDSFNDAVSCVFMKGRAVSKEDGVAGGKKKDDSLIVRFRMQNESLDKFNGAVADAKVKGDMIYSHYGDIEKLTAELELLASKHGWGEVKKRVECSGDKTNIRKIDLKKKMVSAEFGGFLVDIFYEQPVSKSADLYYGVMKKYKSKIEGLEKSILDTERVMAEKKSAEDFAEKKKILRPNLKPQWYHSYRWFESSEGFICVAGKDAKSNENLIKKHMAVGDIVIHADIAGSPFVVIQSNGRKIGKSTIKEAGVFGACYSRAWNIGVGALDVFSANPDQISKEAPSGEFISKGSFMIYGKKNYFSVELKLAFGIVGGFVCLWPYDSIAPRTKKIVFVTPGDDKAKKVAVAVRKKLYEISSKDEKDVLDIIGIDAFASKVPSGKGRILK